MTHRHVGPAPGIPALRDGVHQLPADPEITEFNVALSVEEDVGGFYVTVDDTERGVQVVQGVDHRQGNLSYHCKGAVSEYSISE